MSGPGIDYGMGMANVDNETGIRFGVISQGAVLQAWADSSEPEYGEPTCPECSGAVVESHTVNNDPEEDRWPQYRSHGCCDYACENCEHYLDSGDVFPEEANGWYVKEENLEAFSAFDNTEIFVTKSPYYTTCDFCSPCAPGAGNLNSPNPDGIKAYCFGPDWFEEEDGGPPYPIYRVDNNELVAPQKEEVTP